MPEARFVLKEPKSTSKSLVYLFYRFDGQVLKYSTSEKIAPKFWNATKQRARDNSSFSESSEFNQRLKNIETAVNNCFRRLLNDQQIISKESLKRELDLELNRNKVIKKKLDLIEWMEQEIEIIKTNQKPGSIVVYKALLNHLKAYSNFKNQKLTFESIDLEFYEQFRDYLFTEKKLLTNTFGKRISTLKTFLNIAKEKGLNTSTTYKSKLFKAPEEIVEHIYLTNEELELLYQTDFGKKEHLLRVRDSFLIGCYTGLRFSDFTQLKKENLVQTKNGYVFNVITKKTNEKVVIPVKPIIKRIWDKYHGILPRAISNQKMNDYLKEMAKIAGLSEKVIIKRTSGNEVREKISPKHDLISTHTARRSFATNAFLAGVPPISIMKLTGHRTESSFLKYIKVSPERNAELLHDHLFFQ